MKLKKADFLARFQNEKVSVAELKATPQLAAEKVEYLVRADTNGDGVIAGQEELGRLFDWMAFTNRDNPNQGFSNESLDLSAPPMQVKDILLSVAAAPGVSRAPAEPTRAPAEPTHAAHATHTHAAHAAHAHAIRPVLEPGTTLVRPTTTPVRPSTPTAVSTSDGVAKAAAKAALVQGLVKAGGSATQADVDLLIRDLQKIPTPILQALQNSGVRVVAARGNVTDHITSLKGVRPRGWPPGKTWDVVPGAFYPPSNEVIVATTAAPGGGRMISGGTSHGSANLVIHETLHAYDHIKGMPSKNDADFNRIRNLELAALGRINPYYTQPGEGGQSESYAETAAMFLNNPSLMRSQLPNLYTYWREEFKE